MKTFELITSKFNNNDRKTFKETVSRRWLCGAGYPEMVHDFGNETKFSPFKLKGPVYPSKFWVILLGILYSGAIIFLLYGIKYHKANLDNYWFGFYFVCICIALGISGGLVNSYGDLLSRKKNKALLGGTIGCLVMCILINIGIIYYIKEKNLNYIVDMKNKK